MELDKNAQTAVRNLGATINEAIEKSASVARAIEDLRSLGYEPHLTLKLEIALQKLDDDRENANNDFDDFSGEEENEENEDVELELTDEDVRTLRRMKIRLE